MNYVQRNIIKGYKAAVIKYLALLIGVCYLANPLQSQISGFFHEISHIFEAPDASIAHSSVTDEEYVAHHYHEHTSDDNLHEHTFIDLLDSFFDASDDGSQKESMLVDVKLDKHISTDEYPVSKIYFLEKNINFISKENDLIKGFSSILKEPPQNFLL